MIAALAVAAVAALLLVLPARMPEPQSGGGTETGLVPVGTFAGRKNIYDRRLRELAVSLKLTSVYARPLELREPEMIAGELAAILERDERELLSALKSERTFVWLGRRLEAGQAERIAALEAEGLYFVDEEQRYYPQHQTAAHVLGFLSNDQGLAGVEFYYEQILQGGWGGSRKLPQDPQGPPGLAGEEGGAHLVLTLDLDLQTLVEQELAKVRKETGAAAAMALVMEPASGEIHALVNLPAFDPNRFWKFNSESRRNRVLVDAVYPGGLWNIFRVAAAAATGGPDLAGSEENEEAPFLAPRRRKTREGKTGPVHPDWVKLEDGIHASPAIVNIPGTAPDAKELGRLVSNLGMAGEIGIDLPLGLENGSPPAPSGGLGLQGNTAAVSALQLLAAFNRLIVGEDTSPPHLLKALWPAGNEPHAVDYATRPPTTGSGARQAALTLLRGGGDQPEAVAESLIDKGLVASADDAGQTADSCRRQDVLLGVRWGEKTSTILLVLDGACIDLTRPSPLRNAGRRLLKRLASRPPKADGPPVPGDNPPGKLYRQWREVHDPAAPDGDHAGLRPNDRMPDVKGHALRQALQTLQPYGISIEISGSGRVIGQEPKVGSPLTGVGQIRLELQAD